MAHANVNDVAARLGRAVSDAGETDQIETWLEDVERLILRRIPDLADRITDGLVTVADIAMVEAQSVVRKVKNPDGKQNERVDDYSYGLVEDAARAELFITDDEWAILLGTVTAGSGAFTIRPAGWRRTVPPIGPSWPL